jgi:hypothetical protein
MLTKIVSTALNLRILVYYRRNENLKVNNNIGFVNN